MQEPKIERIDFDFDGYDFWAGWDDDDLADVDEDESRRKYFMTLARRIAEPWGVPWSAEWSRESGTGHKVYVTFANELADGNYELRQDVEHALAATYLEQDDWVVS